MTWNGLICKCNCNGDISMLKCLIFMRDIWGTSILTPLRQIFHLEKNQVADLHEQNMWKMPAE